MRIKRTQNIYRIFITFVLILTFLQVATAEIKVSQSVSESKIAYEDTVQFEILVEWEGRQTDYLFNKPLTPFIDRMKIGKFSSSVSSQIIDGVEVTSKKYNYSLIPTSAGLGLIDSMYIAYLKRSDSISGMLLTEPMEILISNPVAKVKEEDDLNEWFIFGFVLVVIFGLFLLFKWKKNSQSVEIELSPKDQFLLDLEQIKKIHHLI